MADLQKLRFKDSEQLREDVRTIRNVVLRAPLTAEEREAWPRIEWFAERAQRISAKHRARCLELDWLRKYEKEK